MTERTPLNPIRGQRPEHLEKDQLRGVLSVVRRPQPPLEIVPHRPIELLTQQHEPLGIALLKPPDQPISDQVVDLLATPLVPARAPRTVH